MSEETKNIWAPKEVSKTLNFIVGLFVIIAGIWLIVKVVKADGIFNFKSELISGNLKTSSIGLFVVLFGIIYLLITNLSGVSEYFKLIKNNNVIGLIFILLLLIVSSIIGFLFNTLMPLFAVLGATISTFNSLIYSLRNRN